MIPQSELLPGSIVYNKALEVIEWNEQLPIDERELSPIQLDIAWIRRLGFGTMTYVYFFYDLFNSDDEFAIKFCTDQSICIIMVPEQEGEVYPRHYIETDMTCKFVHQLQKLFHLRTGEFLELPPRYEQE